MLLNSKPDIMPPPPPSLLCDEPQLEPQLRNIDPRRANEQAFGAVMRRFRQEGLS